jgi:hypothetical protein
MSGGSYLVDAIDAGEIYALFLISGTPGVVRCV